MRSRENLALSVCFLCVNVHKKQEYWLSESKSELCTKGCRVLFGGIIGLFDVTQCFSSRWTIKRVHSVALPDRDRSLVVLTLICIGTRSGTDSSAIDHWIIISAVGNPVASWSLYCGSPVLIEGSRSGFLYVLPLIPWCFIGPQEPLTAHKLKPMFIPLPFTSRHKADLGSVAFSSYLCPFFDLYCAFLDCSHRRAIVLGGRASWCSAVFHSV